MSYQCGACQRVFTVLSGFDAHQSVDYRRREAVICVDPASLGMEQNQHGRWYTPADAAERAALAGMRAVWPETHTPGTPQLPGPSESRTAS